MSSLARENADVMTDAICYVHCDGIALQVVLRAGHENVDKQGIRTDAGRCDDVDDVPVC